MKNLSIVKNKIKDLAQQVKNSKNFYKEKQRLFTAKKEFEESKWYPQGIPTKEYFQAFYTKNKLADSYRSTHIAYSLLKGKSYHQIESKIREGNTPDVYDINKAIQEICSILGFQEFPFYNTHYDQDNKFNLILQEYRQIESQVLTDYLQNKKDELVKEIESNK